ncbi:MAG: hypothetical protein NT062_15285 [Proteobacteria bacterium]|nr:hypothetical protein [Pseudomonadota bacterium]
MNRLTYLFLSCAIVVGCKGKPTTEDPPPAKVTKVGSSGSSGGSAGSGSAGSGSAANADMVLPPATGQPPVKTTAKLDEAKLKKLGDLTFESWSSVVRAQTASGVDVRHTTKARPFVQVTVSIAPCFDCLPMELDKWKAKEDVLKQIFPKNLVGQPGVVFESGAVDFHGQPMIWTYQLGLTTKQDENDNTKATYSYAYALYFNDGLNAIRVVSEYKDLPPASVAAMQQLVPREHLELSAKAFMDNFTHAWAD